MGGSPGLVVMGDDSHSRGHGFESWRHILNRHEIFHIDLLQKLYCLFEKTENKWKGGLSYPFIKDRNCCFRNSMPKYQLFAGPGPNKTDHCVKLSFVCLSSVNGWNVMNSHSQSVVSNQDDLHFSLQILLDEIKQKWRIQIYNGLESIGGFIWLIGNIGW